MILQRSASAQDQESMYKHLYTHTISKENKMFLRKSSLVFRVNLIFITHLDFILRALNGSRKRTPLNS